MDAPPDIPPAAEQVIEQRLVECGLKSEGIMVKYQDYLQSIEIVIGENSGATKNDFNCIHNAADHEMVTFKNQELQGAYLKFVAELYRPQMLAEAEKALEKRGPLNDFPKRANFTTDKLFAEALERHCGVEQGTFLIETEWGLTFQPKIADKPMQGPEWDKMTCLMNAMMYVTAKGEPFDVVFVGNENYREFPEAEQ